MQVDLDKEDSAPKISVVIASDMHFDQSTSESLSAEPHSVLPAVSRECGNIGSAQASPAHTIETAAAWDRLSHESRLRQQEVVLQSSEHFDGSTSVSSNSASTGNILAVSRE
jgi:hypothetical protein